MHFLAAQPSGILYPSLRRRVQIPNSRKGLRMESHETSSGRVIRQSPAIREWHIVFGGFGQSGRDGSRNGTLRLWSLVFSLASSKNCCVEWHPWNADVSAIAEKVLEYGSPPLRGDRTSLTLGINIYAYSWGGTAAVRCAEALRARGLSVDVMILSDAVYRHWYTLGQWRALIPGSRLLIPPNVETVRWFYQDHPRFSLRRKLTGNGAFAEPAGHLVVAEDVMKTTVYPGVRLFYDHSHMDNAEEWHDQVLAEIRRTNTKSCY